MKIRIGVVFGGRSSEHEVAVRSAKTVIEHIDREKYTVVPVAIMKEGNWLSPAGSAKWFPAEMIGDFSDDIAKLGEGGNGVIGDTKFKGRTRIHHEVSSRGKTIPL